MADPTPAPSQSKPEPKPEYKIAEVRADGTVIVQMEDGRMFPAEAKEGLALRKHAVVEISHDGTDKDGAPLAAKLVRVKD